MADMEYDIFEETKNLSEADSTQLINVIADSVDPS